MKIKNPSANLKKRFDTTSDLDDRLYLLKKGAKKGYLWALGPLGQEYSTGENIPMDIAKTISLWSLAAEKGSNKARIALGYVYETGEGVSIDLMITLFLQYVETSHTHSLLMRTTDHSPARPLWSAKDSTWARCKQSGYCCLWQLLRE